MDKQVILAVAGAGKTYHICHSIDDRKKNLILAFTHENIQNIQRELCDAYGSVPELTTVMTFDSFVYHDMILPYEPSIAEHFKMPSFTSKGICVVDPPQRQIKNGYGKYIPNPKYIPKEQLGHFVTKREQYYCATISELALSVKQGQKSLIKRVADRLNLFYDAIYIDEFQDFREYDYDLIINLAKLLNKVIMVGDYYQHSVLGKKNSGKPFKRRSGDVSYSDFVEELRKKGFEIDMKTLEKSRRCSSEVCEYVSKKLGINILSNGDHRGSVIWVNDQAEQILSDDKIVKLVYKGSGGYAFPAINWSYSKGNTVDTACVILTEALNDFDSDSFSARSMKVSTLNRLYVAMTRSRGDLYLMKAVTFNKFKDNYLI